MEEGKDMAELRNREEMWGEKRGERRDASRKSGATLSHALRESSEDVDVMISFSNTEVAGGLAARAVSTEARAETNEE